VRLGPSMNACMRERREERGKRGTGETR